VVLKNIRWKKKSKKVTRIFYWKWPFYWTSNAVRLLRDYRWILAAVRLEHLLSGGQTDDFVPGLARIL
jgi:hypothetical protein